MIRRPTIAVRALVSPVERGVPLRKEELAVSRSGPRPDGAGIGPPAMRNHRQRGNTVHSHAGAGRRLIVERFGIGKA